MILFQFFQICISIFVFLKKKVRYKKVTWKVWALFSLWPVYVAQPNAYWISMINIITISFFELPLHCNFSLLVLDIVCSPQFSHTVHMDHHMLWITSCFLFHGYGNSNRARTSSRRRLMNTEQTGAVLTSHYISSHRDVR